MGIHGHLTVVPVHAPAPKLILLVGSYMGKRDYDRFGVEILTKEGLAVEVWECVTPIQGSSSLAPPPPYFPGIVRLTTVGDIAAKIEQLRHNDTVLSILGTSFAARRIHSKLSMMGTRFGVYISGSAQFGDRQPSPSQLIRRILAKFAAPRALLESLAIRMLGPALTENPSFIFLCGGTAAMDADQATTCPAVWAHQFDYDLCLEAGKLPATKPGKHIVYLDDYLPFHPDWKIVGRQPSMTAAEHYPRLTNLFKYLEESLGIPVVIAAHPRSAYESHPDFFEGRSIIRGQTHEMVRDSVCVLLSASTALNFAVVFRKPVIFISTEGIRRYYPFSRLSEKLASILGKTPVDLEQRISLDLKKELSVDEDSYRQYQERYIKRAGTPEQNSWAILARYLRPLSS